MNGSLLFFPSIQPMEVFVDDETKLTLHGLQQYYSKLKDSEKNRKLFDLLDVLEFNQVGRAVLTCLSYRLPTCLPVNLTLTHLI